jgi:hypothetical protein
VRAGAHSGQRAHGGQCAGQGRPETMLRYPVSLNARKVSGLTLP